MGHIKSTTINTDRKRGKYLNFEDGCSIKGVSQAEIFYAQNRR